MALNLSKLKTKLINLSSKNPLISCGYTYYEKGTERGSRNHLDLSCLNIESDIIKHWLMDRDDVLSIDDTNLPIKLHTDIENARECLVDIPEWAVELIDVDGNIIDESLVLDNDTMYKLKQLSNQIIEASEKLDEAQKAKERWWKSISKKFETISDRAREIQKETGKHSLYVGYAFANIGLKSNIQLNAPLLLIPVIIKQNVARIMIYHDTDREIKTNPNAIMALNKFLAFKAEYEVDEVKDIKDICTNIDTLDGIIKGVPGIQRPKEFELKKIGKDKKISAKDLYLNHCLSIGIYDISSSIYNDYTKLEQMDYNSDILNKLFNKDIESTRTGEYTEPTEYIEPKWRSRELNLISSLDQSQEYAVFMANKSKGLVIYGPPGTGKSQVILNIITDQIAQGRRVLLVSQKITALNVVYNRLANLKKYAMLIEDSGASRSEFTQHALESFQGDKIITDKNTKSRLDIINEKIDSKIDELDLIHRQLTTALENTKTNLSFMYKHSSYSPKEEETTIAIMNNCKEIFEYTLREIYEACEEVNNDKVIKAYEVYKEIPNADVIAKTSRLQLRNFKGIQTKLRETNNKISELEYNVEPGFDARYNSIKYREIQSMIDMLNRVIEVLPRTDISNYDIGEYKYRVIDDELKNIEDDIKIIADLNIGTDTVKLDGKIIKLESIESNVEDIVEAEKQQEIEKYTEINSIIESCGIGTDNRITEKSLDDVRVDYVKQLLHTYEVCSEQINTIFKKYKINISDYNSDNLLIDELKSVVNSLIDRDEANIDRCIALYSNINTNNIEILKPEEIEEFSQNVDRLFPSKRAFLSRITNTYSDEDKHKYNILMAIKADIPLKRQREMERVDNYIAEINNGLSKIEILTSDIVDGELSITNMHSYVQNYVSEVRAITLKTEEEIKEYIEDKVDRVYGLVERKKKAEENIGEYTHNIAKAIQCDNTVEGIAAHSASIIEHFSNKVKEQFSLLDTIDMYKAFRSEILDELHELNINIPDNISHDEIDSVIENSETIEMVINLSGLARNLLGLYTEQNISFDEIINSYMLYYIDKLEQSGIGVNVQTRYKNCIEQIDNLEKEKNKLIKQLIYESVGVNLNIDNTRYKAFLGDLKKSRQAKSIRQLMQEYSDVLYQKFPVWMMTPETVSDILPLQAETFDMVIFDEASQMFLENSIPSLYRSKRAIVAGDDKQLKPTQFFTSRTQEDENDMEDDLDITGESLLDQAKVTFDNVKLSFHYRSKYAELIQFSNYAFYNSKLKISPNTLSIHSTYRPIEYIKCNGKYINNENKKEAERVVKLVTDIVKSDDTSNKSVGIITFNLKQKECILDAFRDFKETTDEETRIRLAEIENRKVNGEDVSLFVKNLEEVQGDERDIIIFSIGFARDENDKFNNRFGPLGQSGGENRLNVAISRAKEKEYIVASIEPSELSVEGSKNVGPKIFKQFLEYSKAISNSDYEYADELTKPLDTLIETNRFDSPFEEDVYNHLIEKGWKIDTQVGVYGYRIDLAVYDEKTGTYIAGIECDGAKYHSSKYARERDISRQRFLEGKGWKILRIWSRDWWHNSNGETEKIHQRLLGIQNLDTNIVRKEVFTEADTYASIDELCQLERFKCTDESEVIEKNTVEINKEQVAADSAHQEEITETDERNAELEAEQRREKIRQMKERAKLSNASKTVDPGRVAADFMWSMLKDERLDLGYSYYKDICLLDKYEITGKHVKSIKINGKELDGYTNWKDVLYIAILMELNTKAAERGIDLEKCSDLLRNIIMEQVSLKCKNPAWLSKFDGEHQLKIEGTNWYMNTKASAWDMVSRARKVIENKPGVISILVE